MCDDREDSFCEKNSIAEFEMLEKECFEDDQQVAEETTPPQVAMVKTNSVNETSKGKKLVTTLDLNKVTKANSKLHQKSQQSENVAVN